MNRSNIIPLIILFSLLWLTFAGVHSIAMAILGLLSVFLTVWLVKRVFTITNFTLLKEVNLTSLVLFIPYLIKEIIMANIHVAKLILLNKISPSLITIANPNQTSSGEYIFANSVTLTPGTLIVEYSKEELLVHTLDQQSKEGLLEGSLGRAAAKVEIIVNKHNKK